MLCIYEIEAAQASLSADWQTTANVVVSSYAERVQYAYAKLRFSAVRGNLGFRVSANSCNCCLSSCRCYITVLCRHCDNGVWSPVTKHDQQSNQIRQMWLRPCWTGLVTLDKRSQLCFRPCLTGQAWSHLNKNRCHSERLGYYQPSHPAVAALLLMAMSCACT